MLLVLLVSLRNLLDVLSQESCLLNGYLSQLWMTARISRICGLKTLVADGKETIHARDAVELIYYDSETATQFVAVDTGNRLRLYARYPEEGAGRNLLTILHQNLVVLVISYHLAKLYIHPHAGKEIVCFLGRVL